MPGPTCNACNKEFLVDSDHKIHYNSEWHRYNLKRKVAGLPGVTEALFIARQSAIVEEANKATVAPVLHHCSPCGKSYRSSQAYTQHLNSRAHIMRASQEVDNKNDLAFVVKPLKRFSNGTPPSETKDMTECMEDREEKQKGANKITKPPREFEAMETSANVTDSSDDDENDEFESELDPCRCFMCDQDHDTIESCMVHMHKRHGFFIPDVEYLKDPEGLLIYIGLKVQKDFTCLYCSDRCRPFNSLEAVRKHMEDKSHCRIRYGDVYADAEDAELEEFYDYSSSYVEGGNSEEVSTVGSLVDVEVNGAELIIRSRNGNRISSKILGSRDYMRYYKQNPPRPTHDSVAISIVLATRYRSMGLTTMSSRKDKVRINVLKEMTRSGVEAMRTKIGMKSNVIRNLPKNVPY